MCDVWFRRLIEFFQHWYPSGTPSTGALPDVLSHQNIKHHTVARFLTYDLDKGSLVIRGISFHKAVCQF